MQNILNTYQNNKNSILIWGAVILTVGFLFWSVQYSKKSTIEQMPKILEIKADDYSKGAKDGKVVLVEYLDFECEACKAYYPVLKQLEKDFPNDLKIVTRYFPLQSHKNGMTAALAVEAAARQGKYYEMHDLMYENQPEWSEKALPSPDLFIKYAEKLNLDMNKFKEDAASESAKTRVTRDINEGTILGNSGTPSFFLDGKKLDNPGGLEGLKKLIEEAIMNKV
jgi:protein-disulfide isomerase